MKRFRDKKIKQKEIIEKLRGEVYRLTKRCAYLQGEKIKNENNGKRSEGYIIYLLTYLAGGKVVLGSERLTEILKKVDCGEATIGMRALDDGNFEIAVIKK